VIEVSPIQPNPTTGEQSLICTVKSRQSKNTCSSRSIRRL
jgi:hypothetical protein